MSGSPRPARLDADDVIRFLDGEHFLDELAGNLGRGRAFVRTERTLPIHSQLSIRLEPPGLTETITLEATVVFSREGYAGLELNDFERHLDTLDRLGREVETVSLDRLPTPEPLPATAFVDDEAETGSFEVPPHLRAVDPPPAPASASSDELAAALSAYLSDQPLPAPDTAPPPRPARSDTVIEAPTFDELTDEGETHDVAEDAVDLRGAQLPVSAPPVPEPTPAGDPEPETSPPEPETSPSESAQSHPEPETSPSESAQSHPGPEPSDGGGEAPMETGAQGRADPSPPSAPAEAPADPRDDAKAAEALPDEAGSHPGVPAEGLEALGAPPVLQASPGGAVRFESARPLLGAWLAGLDTGVLTVHGGPSGGWETRSR